MTALVDGIETPVLKQWRFVTSSKRLAVSLEDRRCTCAEGFQHAEISGHRSKKTEIYPLSLCRTILSSLFGSYAHAPAMTCVKPCCQTKHREKDVVIPEHAVSPNHMPSYPDLWDETPEVSPLSSEPTPSSSSSSLPLSRDERLSACVTKLLDRKEWAGDARALEAIRKEAQGLLAEKTWLPETVIEKTELKSWASRVKKKIHIGDLLLLCSIKFFEMPEAYHKHKGRICFRGDNARDEAGALAIYQELSASPTAIHSANCNIAYGCIPGHKTTQADAIRAYVQSLLASQYDTYVRIPRDLWPQEWIDAGMIAPCCKLNKALYGHPEAGGHWEAHLHKAIQACGGTSVPNHPSSYWMESTKLLLTVYVDDLLLSGPAASHDSFWKSLQAADIRIDPPEDLDRFLGRSCVPV